MYNPHYSNKWALIVGINKYQTVGDLGYACSDAEAISKLLIEEFQFPEENVTLLLDENATKENIIREYMKFTRSPVEPDDQILFFYAGHGHTITSRRGEVGYLIPHDAQVIDSSTFIRWDELTRNSDLISAKHVLFIMDACYGGLAITRSLPPGSQRFLKDMMRRYSRQVLTAGKADETVADANGPIPEHSIFTGHLIQAMQGNAANADGVITANGVMSYVYEKVSKDIYSNQTPHYGFIDGDGDFIFKAPILNAISESDKEESDILVEVPATYHETSREADDSKKIEKIKEYLSEEKYRIKMDDLVNVELRSTISLLSADNFPLNDNSELFIDRLKRYDGSINNLESYLICISHWGNDFHNIILKKSITRLVENNNINGGYVRWLNLRYYPVLKLLYSSGIAAIANEKYDVIYTIFMSEYYNRYRSQSEKILYRTISELTEIHDVFKEIPEHERFHVPRSEYLFKDLQPKLDDLLFLGQSYEKLFDEFEIIMALVYADITSGDQVDGETIWGPLGRFAYKMRSGDTSFNNVLEQADLYKENWKPLKAGLFRGSFERFQLISSKFKAYVQKMYWY